MNTRHHEKTRSPTPTPTPTTPTQKKTSSPLQIRRRDSRTSSFSLSHTSSLSLSFTHLLPFPLLMFNHPPLLFPLSFFSFPLMKNKSKKQKAPRKKGRKKRGRKTKLGKSGKIKSLIDQVLRRDSNGYEYVQKIKTKINKYVCFSLCV